MITHLFGFLFSIKTMRKGIIITAVPVRKPDLVALVNFNPIVWVAKPVNRRTPNKIPPIKDFLLYFFLNINGASIIPAKVKRMKMKAIVEISSRAPLTMTKVAPHKIVTKIR